MVRTLSSRPLRLSVAAVSLAALSACSGGLDLDMRGKVGNNFSTADAARSPVANRPEPDARGLISYPSYQVAVARRGGTLADVAARVGLPAAEVARYNGIKPEDRLRAGELIALPRRVAETSGAGTISNPADVSITELAGNAIDSTGPTPARPGATGSSAVEPIRHRVERGETVYTIARLYNVSVRALADWNALDRNYTLREGQFLLIPVAQAAEPVAAAVPSAPQQVQTAALEPAPVATSRPGQGTPTPTPPSASTPLPTQTPPAAAAAPRSEPTTTTVRAAPVNRDAAMGFPVDGSIVREYAKGRNDGIDISAAEGAPVKAAASGVVAAVTSDADNIPIVIVKHPDNVLTIYANIGGIKVKKDDRVSRGQQLGTVRPGSPPYLHFEVRKGFDSVDPMPYLK